MGLDNLYVSYTGVLFEDRLAQLDKLKLARPERFKLPPLWFAVIERAHNYSLFKPALSLI